MRTERSPNPKAPDQAATHAMREGWCRRDTAGTMAEC